MHGSQFQLEQTLNTKRFSTTELQNYVAAKKSTKKTWLIAGLVLGVLFISTSSFAGPKEPKIGGGNGNANGR